jgi:hypothetical protein
LIIFLGAAASAAVLAIGIFGAHQQNQEMFDSRAQEMVSSLQSVWSEYQSILLWIHQSCDLISKRHNFIIIIITIAKSSESARLLLSKTISAHG